MELAPLVMASVVEGRPDSPGANVGFERAGKDGKT